MISYNNGEVVQSLRQYEMFANSLKLISSNEEKKMVINQLNKLLAKIIKESNVVYEEEYNKLYEREIEFIDEERTRLTLLVELINQRISYVDKLCQKHYQLTYENIELPPEMPAASRITNPGQGSILMANFPLYERKCIFT